MTDHPHLQLVTAAPQAPEPESARELPSMTPAELLGSALEAARIALDAAHAEGYAVPPVAAQGLATLGVALVVLAGQEAERRGAPLSFADAMAEAERVRAKLAPDAPPIGAAE